MPACRLGARPGGGWIGSGGGCCGPVCVAKARRGRSFESAKTATATPPSARPRHTSSGSRTASGRCCSAQCAHRTSGHGVPSLQPRGWRAPTCTRSTPDWRRSWPTPSTMASSPVRRARVGPRHRRASNAPTSARPSRCGRSTTRSLRDCEQQSCWGRSPAFVTRRCAGCGSATSTSCAASSTRPCNIPPSRSRLTHRGRCCRSRTASRSRCRLMLRSGRPKASCWSTSGATNSRRGRCNGRFALRGRRCQGCRPTSGSTTCGTTSPACSSPAVPT